MVIVNMRPYLQYKNVLRVLVLLIGCGLSSIARAEAQETLIQRMVTDAKQAVTSKEALKDLMNVEIINKENLEVVVDTDPYIGLYVSAKQGELNKGVRSEITFDYPYQSGDTVTYQWKMKLPEDFKSDSPDNRWWSMAQWHDQPDVTKGETWDSYPSNSPPVAFYYGVWKGKDVLALEYKNIKSTENDLITISRNQWLNLKVEIKWSQATDGYLKLFVDNSTQPQITKSGPNMNNNYQHYLKLGMYRHPEIKTDNWIYLDNVDISLVPAQP